MARAAHALHALLLASCGPWWAAHALLRVSSGAANPFNDTDNTQAAATRLVDGGTEATIERQERLEELVGALEAAVRAHQRALEAIATVESSTGLALAGTRSVVSTSPKIAKDTSKITKEKPRKSEDSGIARNTVAASATATAAPVAAPSLTTVRLHSDQKDQEAHKVGNLDAELAELKMLRSKESKKSKQSSQNPKAKEDPEQWDGQAAFESVVFNLFGCFIGIFIVAIAIVPSCRLAFTEYLGSLWRGELRRDDPNASLVDKYEELKSRMDIKSTHFIAPGNIYRVTAVMHPGIVGFRPWCLHVLTALVCAFIQLYVSARIISDFSEEWECLGLKSPSWYSNHFGDFIAMLCFTATLNLMFSGKAAENIIEDVEANLYILTHQAPLASRQVTFALPDIAGAIAEGAAEAGKAFTGSSSLGTSNLGTTMMLGTGMQRPVPAPEGYVPEFLKDPETLYAQEYLWCLISMVINVVTSILLQVVFALRMMTFSGNLESVVSVAIVLYFIFQLDGTLMDLDPALRPKYRLEVLRRTVERKDKPVWLPRIGAFSRAMSSFTGSCCLVAYVLLRWRSRRTGEVLGGATR